MDDIDELAAAAEQIAAELAELVELVSTPATFADAISEIGVDDADAALFKAASEAGEGQSALSVALQHFRRAAETLAAVAQREQADVGS